MRILFVVNRYPPHMGGLEFHVANLARELSALGNEVAVVALEDRPCTRSDGSVGVTSHRGYFNVGDVISFPAPHEFLRLRRMLIEHHIDVVSTHTRFFPMSAIGLRAAHSVGVPVVHTEHGSGFVASDSPAIAMGSRVVDVTVGRYVLRNADKVLAISGAAGDFVRRLAHVEADVFPNAVHPAMFRNSLIDRPKHLVFVGRVVQGKGWDTFLRAVAALRGEGIDVDAELLGGGPQLNKAVELVRVLGLQDSVTIRGRVAPSEVRASLSGATLINPTVLSEGFQTTLIEAVIEGGRVVTYDVPGARLLQDEGAPVLLTQHRDEAELLESIRTTIGSPGKIAAAESMKKWTWPVRAREYETILKGIVGSSQSKV